MIQLKENQKELLQNCEDEILFSKPVSSIETNDNGRNRIETRKADVYTNSKQFITNLKWNNHIISIILVERITSLFSTKTKTYKDRKEKAIYLANFELTAEQAGNIIRKHWYIENKDHYVRDETLKEDRARIRINPENMSTLRSFALNVLRKNNCKNINGEVYENSLDYYNIYSYKHFI